MAVGSVVKAVAVLRYLAGSSPRGVNVIARAIAISPSSCFAILKTLVSEGFLDFDPEAKTYSIGPEPAHLFSIASNVRKWRDWMEGELQEFATKHLLSFGLWRRSGERLELLSVADSPLDIRLHFTVGQRLPAYIGAMGRCLAAREHISEREVLGILDGLRWDVAPSIAEYMADLAAVARQGWAYDDGKYFRGVTTIAVAIADADGSAGYLVNASGFSGQVSKTAHDLIGEDLLDLSRRAEAELKRVVAAR